MAAKKSAQSPQESTVTKSKDKSAAFVRLAEQRVSRAIVALGKIEGLSNRRSYTYDDAQVTKIKSALQASVDKVSKSFDNAGKPAAESGFKFTA